MTEPTANQDVFHISISIAASFKDTMETSLTTADYESIRPFIMHLVNNCNAQLEEASKAKQKSSIIMLG